MLTVLRSLLIPFAIVTHVFGEAPKPKEFQYDSQEIKVRMPQADTPRVKTFGAESVRAASKYLDDGAVAWTRERKCVACHTTGEYLLTRPALISYLGPMQNLVIEEFRNSFTDKLPESRDNGGVIYYPQSERAVWRTAAMVQWDKYVNKALSPLTEKALIHMLQLQANHGGYHHGNAEVEIPYVTTDFELSLHALRGVVDAPGWLMGLQDEDTLQRIHRLKAYLRDAPMRHDYDRVIRLELVELAPELIHETDQAAALTLLTAYQHADGGWSTRDFSETRNWRSPMSEKVIGLIESLPDASSPESDPYMTALAILLYRRAGVEKGDERVQRGVAWLKREQREGGFWWMHSLYRGNYHFTTYISTAKALQALAACAALPMISEGEK